MSVLQELRTELRASHPREQVWRLFRLTTVAFAAQLAALGPAHLTRDALVGAGIAAAEAVYRQATPAVPLREAAAWLARGQKRLAQKPAPAASQVSQDPADPAGS